MMAEDTLRNDSGVVAMRPVAAQSRAEAPSAAEQGPALEAREVEGPWKSVADERLQKFASLAARLQKEIEKLKKDLADAAALHEAGEARIAALTAELAVAKSALEHVQGSFRIALGEADARRVLAEKHAALEQAHAQSLEQLAAKEAEIVDLRKREYRRAQEATELRVSLEKVSAELAHAQHEAEEAQKGRVIDSEALRATREELAYVRDAAHTRAEKDAHELVALKAASKEISLALAAEQEAHAETTRTLHASVDARNAIQHQLDLTIEAARDAQDRLVQAERERDGLENELSNLKDSHAELVAKRAAEAEELEKLIQHRAVLTDDLLNCDSRRGALETELGQAHVRIYELEQTCAELRQADASRAALANELVNVYGKCAELEGALGHANNRAYIAEQGYAAIAASTSWRVLAPARRAVELLRKIRQKVLARLRRSG